MAGVGDAPLMQNIAVPAVCLLVAFLGYFSQFVFHNATLEPGPPTRSETVLFNSLLAILWITYYRAVTVDPGRYVFPEQVYEVSKTRWCNKCSAPKPLRAHHCRHCARCIPKMDHHCPWTRNCVSMTTFPHFLRFLVYTNLALWMMGYLLWQRFSAIWQARDLPAYLGPSLPALACLALLGLVGFTTSVALGILLITTIKSWVFNQSMIEGWEIDRHEAIANRGSRDWWDVTGPDGEKYRFEKTEFPYDIGFFANMAQAMGSSNPFWWFFPFAGHPKIDKTGKGTGWDWEENGFNRVEGMWPPIDPEKIRRAARAWPAAKRDFAAELQELEMDGEERKRLFLERQHADFKRQRKIVAELEEVESGDEPDDVDDEYDLMNGPGKAWVNSDGERLQDYGVDEEVDDDHDDEVPLAELLRRRKTV